MTKDCVSRGNFYALLAAVLLSAVCADGQMPGAGGSAGMTTALLKLFGGINAFTARAEVQVLDDSQKEVSNVPMDFSLLDKRIRVDIDQSQTKSRSMPPGAAETLKQMGMARVVSILCPDKQAAYVFYPDQKVMMTLPLPEEDSDTAPGPKTLKTPLGKETVDGHSCVKNKVVINFGQGEPVEAVTWNATDLKDFPVQIQTKEKPNTSIIRFKQVQFEKPDASRFEPPIGYTKYNDPQDLMQGVMKKAMEGASKK